MNEPDLESLVAAIHAYCDAVPCERPNEERCRELIGHVLGDVELDGINGRKGWACMERGIITEVELCSLLMAHTGTKVCQWAGLSDPGIDAESSADLQRIFETALYGRPARR